MQVIDAGELTIDTLVRDLLTPGGLSRLLKPNSMACLVLARRALMPSFFEELIANVHTIDGTLREHVEFIVFHGGTSTIGIRGVDAEYAYRARGISLSSARVEAGPHSDVNFSDLRANEIRESTRSATAEAAARATEIAVSVLKDRFGLAERQLPCLIFVDGGNVAGAPIVVPMAQEHPVRSLYADILAPLSDAFTELAPHWKLAARAKECEEDFREAALQHQSSQRYLTNARDRLAREQAKLAAVAGRTPERQGEIDSLEVEREGLRSFVKGAKSAKSLDQRLKFVPAGHEARPELIAMVESIRAWEAALQTTSGTPEGGRLRKLVEKNTSRALSLIGHTRAAAETRLREIEKRFAEIGFPTADVLLTAKEAQADFVKWEQAGERGEQWLSHCRRWKDDIAPRAVDEAAALRLRGYDDSVIGETRYGARALVSYMLATQQIGAFRKTLSGTKRLKVLLITSAPNDQTRLDLGDEIRAIYEQVRGARFRDDIEMVTGPAATPDDLVRLLGEHRPNVVHFSGHGDVQGITLRNERGDAVTVRTASLERLFLGRGVQLVVLNSCFSEFQAEKIAATGAVVLGTTQALNDEAAKRFSAAFYRAIANGLSIKESFRDGVTAVDLHNFPDVYKIIGDADASMLGSKS